MLEQVVVRNKKPAIDLDTGRPVTDGNVLDETPQRSTVLQYAGSDRPAFVVRAVPAADAAVEGGEVSPVRHELLHWYPAMGLPQQHWAQQVLLARCYSHDMAVSVIDVIKRRLGVDCARTLVEAAAPTGKWTEADVDGWKADFLERLEAKVGELPAAPPGCPLTGAHGRSPPCWRNVTSQGRAGPGGSRRCRSCQNSPVIKSGSMRC